MGGPRMTPEQLERAAEVFESTQNTSEAARAVGVSESTLRAAFTRARIARNRELHVRAVERGLRTGRAHIATALDMLGEQLVDELKSGVLEPGERAQCSNAMAALSRELRGLAGLDLKRRQAALTRAKTRAEIERIRQGGGDELSADERAVLRTLIAQRPQAANEASDGDRSRADQSVASDPQGAGNAAKAVGT